jgi:hypothetical protein
MWQPSDPPPACSPERIGGSPTPTLSPRPERLSQLGGGDARRGGVLAGTPGFRNQMVRRGAARGNAGPGGGAGSRSRAGVRSCLRAPRHFSTLRKRRGPVPGGQGPRRRQADWPWRAGCGARDLRARGAVMSGVHERAGSVSVRDLWRGGYGNAGL